MPGCGSSTDLACTEIGCSDTMSVVITAATGTLAVGAYQVLVESNGGGVAECLFTVTTDCAGADHCVDESEDCNAIYMVGYDQPDTVTISSGLTEGVIGVQVLIDDVGVHDQDHDPEGVTSQPNGEGCEPICTSRQVDVELDGR
jgi:hypothetical protein